MTIPEGCPCRLQFALGDTSCPPTCEFNENGSCLLEQTGGSIHALDALRGVEAEEDLDNRERLW